MATLFRFTDLIGEAFGACAMVHNVAGIALRKLSEPDEHGDYQVDAFVIAHSGNRVYGVFHTPFTRVWVGKLDTAVWTAMSPPSRNSTPG